ncbi:hypothetical protein CASFOL_005042 [Castilleja foliolosa]|uniref:Uncharacterized protein n=1 Tax=Castilleja foliolosa TaxID=1961234 RepID=A0ABD3E6C4_9LAMI
MTRIASVFRLLCCSSEDELMQAVVMLRTEFGSRDGPANLD